MRGRYHRAPRAPENFETTISMKQNSDLNLSIICNNLTPSLEKFFIANLRLYENSLKNSLENSIGWSKFHIFSPVAPIGSTGDQLQDKLV